MTDKELVEGCVREDRIAQKYLWDHYSSKLLALCMRYTQNQEEAEDALMEAYVKIYDNMKKFRFQSALETWMRRICVNVSINKLRARKNIFNELSESEFELGYLDSQYNQLQANQIMELVHQLPTGYKTVFNLFAVEGYSHKEISQLLKIDEGTSRSQLAKARKVLQEWVIKLGLDK